MVFQVQHLVFRVLSEKELTPSVASIPSSMLFLLFQSCPDTPWEPFTRESPFHPVRLLDMVDFLTVNTVLKSEFSVPTF